MAHVGLGPSPQLVKLGLFVQLHADHHAIGHALSPHVLIACIQNIGRGIIRLEVDLVLFVLKEIMPYLGYPLVCLRLGKPQPLRQQVAVLAREERSLHLTALGRGRSEKAQATKTHQQGRQKTLMTHGYKVL